MSILSELMQIRLHEFLSLSSIKLKFLLCVLIIPPHTGYYHSSQRPVAGRLLKSEENLSGKFSIVPSTRWELENMSSLL